MNRLSNEHRAGILHLLCEGNSTRAVTRLTGASKTMIGGEIDEVLSRPCYGRYQYAPRAPAALSVASWLVRLKMLHRCAIAPNEMRLRSHPANSLKILRQPDMHVGDAARGRFHA